MCPASAWTVAGAIQIIYVLAYSLTHPKYLILSCLIIKLTEAINMKQFHESISMTDGRIIKTAL